MPQHLVDLLPQPIEEIIVQADLTAVAPGPLTHQVAQDLRHWRNKSREERGSSGSAAILCAARTTRGGARPRSSSG